MMNLLNEMASLYRFFVGTSKDDKAVVFYAEHKDYFPYFEGLVGELINKHNQSLCYVTSDPDDPILRNPKPKIRTYYLDKLLPIFMAVVNCKVFVMTLTDLNQFHLRRSINPVHYVYVFHSPISTHMIYRYGAFDHYDSILCVGQHQVEEIRRHEKLHGLTPKRLIEAGYSRVEKVYKAYKRHDGGEGITVLVAPTWGTPNLYDICGLELIEVLLKEGYEVILGFHPEIVKRGRHFSYNGATTETSLLTVDSIAKADVLITNWSGVSLEYAFGTERPVIFIDTPPKIRNLKYKELGIEPVESFLREKIGVVVSPKELDTIPKVISNLILNRLAYREDIIELRGKYMYAFGHSTEIGAQYIKDLV